MSFPAGYSQETPFQVDGLIAGGTYTTRKVTIASGNNEPRGAVIGQITVGGEYKLSASGAGDGSETPDLVLLHDVDASSGAKEGIAVETGQVVGSALTLGAGHTIDSIREGLRDKGITIDD